MAAVRVRACSGPSREKELGGLGWRRLVALCPGERAVAAPGGAKFQGWRPGCGGVGSRCEAARCLGNGGLAEQSPRAPALSCRPRRLRHSAAATKRWCFQHDGAKAEDGPRAGRTARGKGSGSIGWARPGQRSPPEVRAGARAEGSSCHLLRGRRRPRAWSAERVLGCWAPRSSRQGSAGRGPGDMALGSSWGWYLRGPGRRARGLRTSAALAGLVAGSYANPLPRGLPGCEDVETPERLLRA